MKNYNLWTSTILILIEDRQHLTYFGSKIRIITNLFKHNNLRIALLTTDTISGFFKTHTPQNYNVYDNGGIYSFTCVTCMPNLRGPN